MVNFIRKLQYRAIKYTKYSVQSLYICISNNIIVLLETHPRQRKLKLDKRRDDDIDNDDDYNT